MTRTKVGSTRSKVRRVGRRVARRVRDTRIPLTVVASLTPMAMDVYGGYRAAGVGGALDHLGLCTTGVTRINGQVEFKPVYALKNLYVPLLGGMLAHKMANRFGVNRALKRAGVPFVSI